MKEHFHTTLGIGYLKGFHSIVKTLLVLIVLRALHVYISKWLLEWITIYLSLFLRLNVYNIEPLWKHGNNPLHSGFELKKTY